MYPCDCLSRNQPTLVATGYVFDGQIHFATSNHIPAVTELRLRETKERETKRSRPSYRVFDGDHLQETCNVLHDIEIPTVLFDIKPICLKRLHVRSVFRLSVQYCIIHQCIPRMSPFPSVAQWAVTSPQTTPSLVRVLTRESGFLLCCSLY